MAAITNLSDWINLATNGGAVAVQRLVTWKDSRVDAAAAATPIAGQWTSLWRYESAYGDGGGNPGAVAATDRTTQGAMALTNPTGGRQLWMTGARAAVNSAGTLLLCDRLLHIGGLSGTVTTAQTVGGTLTRNTGGVGNLIGVEIETQIGVTGTTITANYTDDAGNAGQTSTATAIGNSGLREAQRFIPLNLADGDRGARAVASVTLLASTGTAGAFSVVVYRPLAEIQVSASVGCNLDFLSGSPGPIEIPTDACLFWLWLPVSVTGPRVFVELTTVEK